MEYLLTASQIKDADRYTIEQLGIPSRVLMERAAMACIDYMDRDGWAMGHVCIVCGSGNNGGDGFAIGRLLLERGTSVELVFAGNQNHCTEETAEQMRRYCEAGGVYRTDCPQIRPDVVVDALFGVGLNREVTGAYRKIIDWMNGLTGKKLAVDIPSGVDASTGNVWGCAFRADATVTMQEKKIGLLCYPAADFAGVVETAHIGVDSSIITNTPHAAYTVHTTDATNRLPARVADSNKGTYGKLLVIAGSTGMAGAAYMSAHAAYMSGAGLVRIYTTEDNRIPLQSLLPEAIVTTYEQFDEAEVLRMLDWASAVCIGPGMGTGDCSARIVETVIRTVKTPCLVDADAINLIAKKREWLDVMRDRAFLLTPHMMELSRLTGCPIAGIKKDRRAFAQQFCDEYGVVLVEKDARTIVCAKGMQAYLNITGNAAMAKAGSGDVLAGVIGGLLAQGMDGYEAAVLGVYVHGASGDAAARMRGMYSVMARDLIEQVADVIKKLDGTEPVDRY